MIKTALILHAWYNHPADNWYPWLKKELENKGYQVFIPELPTMNTDLPDLTQQLSFINTKIAIDQKTVIIGHSLGCLLALRLAEKTRFQKMFLVAGWDFNDLFTEHRLFWKTPINHKLIKQNVSEIYVVHSNNDPYITEFTANEMNKRLSGKFILIKEAGHFIAKGGITQIPQIIDFI